MSIKLKKSYNDLVWPQFDRHNPNPLSHVSHKDKRCRLILCRSTNSIENNVNPIRKIPKTCPKRVSTYKLQISNCLQRAKLYSQRSFSSIPKEFANHRFPRYSLCLPSPPTVRSFSILIYFLL